MKTVGNFDITGSIIQSGSDNNQFLGDVAIANSKIFKGGSTKFGDDATDSHQFTGSIFGTDMRVNTVTYSTPTNYIETGSYNDGFADFNGLEIHGNSAITFNVNGFDAMSIYYDGDVSEYYVDVSPSTFYDGSSTITLKDNIQPLDQSYLDSFDNLLPKQWTWNETSHKSGSNDIGFVAEDVIQLYPDLIKSSSNGDVMGIFYQKFTPIIVQALLDARQRISNLEAQLSGSL